MSWTAGVADSIGVAEDAFRLIMGMCFAYPVMLVHNLFVKRQPATVQHVYFVATGMALAYWALGTMTLVHGGVCVLVNYLVLRIFGGSFNTAAFLFIFQMIYLSVGYIVNTNVDYAVNWTMPHCVLCLRLIGVAMDCYDGSRPEEELSKDQKTAKLAEVPSLLEMCSHVFYLGSYFVGPQFTMTKFRGFIQRNIEDGDMTGSLSFGTRRFVLAWVYFGMHLAFGRIAPHDFVMSEEFTRLPYWKMYAYMTVWCKAILAKYIGAWLLSEGATIYSGLAYNGRKEDGSILWNGGANVKLRKFEYCYNFGQVVESFNINTNTWCMNYIYKRCRWMNNKFYSQAVTMTFLAIWHGFHSGYYLTFFNEILVMQFEKTFIPACQKNPTLSKLWQENIIAKILFIVIGKFYVLFFMPHCFLPFAVLKSKLYLPFLWTTKAPVFLFFGTWPMWGPHLTKFLKGPKTEKTPTVTASEEKTPPVSETLTVKEETTTVKVSPGEENLEESKKSQ